MTTQTPTAERSSYWPRPAASRPPHESSYGYFDENGDFILYSSEQDQEAETVQNLEGDQK